MVALNNFTDIPIIVEKDVKQISGQRHKRPVLIVRKSNHPTSDNLYLVLAEATLKEKQGNFVVWTYDDMTQELANGEYDVDLKHALLIIANRLWDVKKGVENEKD